MTQPLYAMLSRRERLIMDLIYSKGPLSARSLRAALPGDPNYSTVRTQLRILQRKGYVRIVRGHAPHRFAPAVPLRVAARQELHRLVRTFFGDSIQDLKVALADGGQ